MPGAEAELVAMLESPDRPEYVVRTGMPAPFPDGGQAFWDALDERYRMHALIGPVAIYRAVELK